MPGCTVGAVFNKDGMIIFKNRDLWGDVTIPEPTIESQSGTQYIRFGTDSVGVWAGINEHGVGVVGADGNGVQNVAGDRFGKGEMTWAAYEKVLSSTRSLKEAYTLIIEEYETHLVGGAGDIILLADKKRAVVLEYSKYGEWGVQFCRAEPVNPPYDSPYILRTNFFILLTNDRPHPTRSAVHMSSEARYQRAVSHLSRTMKNTSVDDIKALLRDHAFEKSAFSICRHGGSGEYKTVGSTIMSVKTDGIAAHYIVNNQPCEQSYKVIEIDLSK